MKSAIAVIACTTISGCAMSPVSWDALGKNMDNEGYCRASYSDAADIDRCNIEMAARKRARDSCSGEAQKERCEIMAGYSWDSFKFFLQENPTMYSAQNYIVMCGSDPATQKPCQEPPENQ